MKYLTNEQLAAWVQERIEEYEEALEGVPDTPEYDHDRAEYKVAISHWLMIANRLSGRAATRQGGHSDRS
jgi:hypothetical protein